MLNLESMDADELRALIKSGGLIHAVDEPEPEPDYDSAVRVVTVADRFSVEVDPAIMQSWRFVDLLSRAMDPAAGAVEHTARAVEFARFVLGDKLGDAIDYLGGPERASFEDVMQLVNDVIEAARLKN